MSSSYKFCQEYLAARGITAETSRIFGLEFDDQLRAKTVKERLGLKLPKGVNEVIWIPLHDAGKNVTSWIARLLPTIGDQRFLCALKSGCAPYIPWAVYDLKHDKPLIITEGPIKALACVQAGFAAIGLNGVWGASVANANGLYVIRADLQAALNWRGRKVYLAFDTDCESNDQVRQAMIRLFLVLSAQGAEVYRMNWELKV